MFSDSPGPSKMTDGATLVNTLTTPSGKVCALGRTVLEVRKGQAKNLLKSVF